MKATASLLSGRRGTSPRRSARRADRIHDAALGLAAAANKEGELRISGRAAPSAARRARRLLEKNINDAYGTSSNQWRRAATCRAWATKSPSRSGTTSRPVGRLRRLLAQHVVFGKHALFIRATTSGTCPTHDRRHCGRDTYVKIYAATIGFSTTRRARPRCPSGCRSSEADVEGQDRHDAVRRRLRADRRERSLGPQKTLEFAKAFSNPSPAFMLCQEADRVASGEFVAFAMDCGGATCCAPSARAPMVRVLVPRCRSSATSTLCGAEERVSPNAASCFITYALSRRPSRPRTVRHGRCALLPIPRRASRSGAEKRTASRSGDRHPVAGDRERRRQRRSAQVLQILQRADAAEHARPPRPPVRLLAARQTGVVAMFAVVACTSLVIVILPLMLLWLSFRPRIRSTGLGLLVRRTTSASSATPFCWKSS